MPEYVHQYDGEGEVITFSWLGEVEVEPVRVYALAFTMGLLSAPWYGRKPS